MTAPISINTPGNDPVSTSAPESNTDNAAHEIKAVVLAGAHDLGDSVKRFATNAVGETKKGAESQIDMGKARVAEGLGTVANALRKTGEQLRAEKNDTLTSYIDTVVQKMDGLSHYIDEQSPSDIASDVKEFARREPALFFGGALLVGLMGGRFLKSSPPAPNRGGPSGRSRGERSRASLGQGRVQGDGSKQTGGRSRGPQVEPASGQEAQPKARESLEGSNSDARDTSPSKSSRGSQDGSGLGKAGSSATTKRASAATTGMNVNGETDKKSFGAM